MTETQLSGENCPPNTSPQPDPQPLPRVGQSGTPPLRGCFVVANEPDVAVTFGAGAAFAPIAIFNGYAPFLAQEMSGYRIELQGVDFTGWVESVQTVLTGDACP